MMARLLALNIPTVLVGNALPDLAVDSVSSANHAGAYQATRHLIEHGHRQIAYLSGPADWAPIRERCAGYLQALREQELAPTILLRPGLRVDDGRGAIGELLDRHPQVTAVLAANDPVAIGAMHAAKEAGRAIPEDLAFIGFDNIAWTENTEPSLTTVYIHKQHMGKMAARRLLDILQNPHEPVATIQIENELVVRRSCGCG